MSADANQNDLQAEAPVREAADYVPRALIAEVTHRCPLHCVYCSNPLEMQGQSKELRLEEWESVLEQAAALGVLQLHLTGGEPLARPDLTSLIAAARRNRLYVNLITSGIGLNQARLNALVEAGLDHIQLSFQDCEEATANEYAGTRAHARKLELAEMIRKSPLAFTVNAVVHRGNLDRLDGIIAMAGELGAHRLEIANVQYYAWALENRDRLLPTREQVMRSIAVVDAARERLSGKLRIEFVAPDYYARFPKSCMGGWGRGLLLIDPAGRVMPCHAAAVIPGLEFPSVSEHSLRSIWEDSAVFNRFRGEDWMQEPCKSCDRRERDFGGCRCQALLLTGDADATDPVCSLSPQRGIVDAILAAPSSAPDTVLIETAQRDWVYRVDPVAG